MVDVEDEVDTETEIGRALADAAAFLEQHATAKIVVVLDTHCIEDDGRFIWGGDKANYQTCRMEEVCLTWL